MACIVMVYIVMAHKMHELPYVNAKSGVARHCANLVRSVVFLEHLACMPKIEDARRQNTEVQRRKGIERQGHRGARAQGRKGARA